MVTQWCHACRKQDHVQLGSTIMPHEIQGKKQSVYQWGKYNRENKPSKAVGWGQGQQKLSQWAGGLSVPPPPPLPWTHKPFFCQWHVNAYRLMFYCAALIYNKMFIHGKLMRLQTTVVCLRAISDKMSSRGKRRQQISWLTCSSS